MERAAEDQRTRQREKPKTRREQETETAKIKFDEIRQWAAGKEGVRQKSLTPRKGVAIGKSTHAGFGVFARNEFNTGDRILEYEGDRINQTEANEKEEIYGTFTDGMYLFALHDDTIIDATLSYTIARFINHAEHRAVINAYAGTLPQP